MCRCLLYIIAIVHAHVNIKLVSEMGTVLSEAIFLQPPLISWPQGEFRGVYQATPSHPSPLSWLLQIETDSDLGS